MKMPPPQWLKGQMYGCPSPGFLRRRILLGN
jgi:hypothetical protein